MFLSLCTNGTQDINAGRVRESHKHMCVSVPVGHFYLSLGVSWQRLMSGTEVTPQRLYCPSPMERDTSSTPKTRPSLEQGENIQTVCQIAATALTT